MPGYNSITGDESIMYADNCSFDGTERGGKLSADKQIWIGSGTAGTKVKRGTIVSGAGVTITQTDTSLTEANLTFALAGGGAGVDSFAMQTGTSPIVPDGTGLVTFNGSSVAAGTNPVRTNGTAANTMQLEVQTSVALAAADATRIGLANFDSDIFTVTATGFVSTTEGTLVQAISGGPGITITGTAALPIVNSVIFTDHAVSTSVIADSGSYATAAITLTTPAVPAQGEELIFVCTTASALIVDAASTHLIRMGSAVSSAGGTCTSTDIGCSITLRWRDVDSTWYCVGSQGIWILA